VPISIKTISATEADSIISRVEDHFTDFKAKPIRPAKLSETLSAFANADGGELFVGVGEGIGGNYKWDGFSTPEAANGHLQALEQLFPLGRDFQYDFLTCDAYSGYVLHIQVLKTQGICLASDGVPYLRRGAQKQPVRSLDQIRQLEYAKGITSFESELTQARVADVQNSETIIGFMLQVVPSAEPEAWLEKQQLIRNGHATVAAVLLFADEPPIFLPKRAGVKITRYKTHEAEGFREALAFVPLTVEGPLFTQIHHTVDETVRVVEETPRLGDEELENIRYPREAIHEIVTNALLHRDYSIADDVHIRVFDNRIEVESPGRLPGHVTVKNILKERFSRNGTLVRLLNKYPDPPNKDVGEGLNTAFAAMRNLGLKEPVIEERENSVRVTIRHERLASAEELIIKFLSENESIKNAPARELCNIRQDHQMQRIFKGLAERNIIEKIPGTRTHSTAYRLARRFEQSDDDQT
jgi:ATP-dependent DNA helicase RecG